MYLCVFVALTIKSVIFLKSIKCMVFMIEVSFIFFREGGKKELND